ncbi:hypothetical protein IJJ27_03235 [bacterium]|nr:hypothetical protein [bacterium]
MNQYLVAIDGGGTKTEYLLTDLEGKTIKSVTHGPTNVTAGLLGQAAYNLREGMRVLLEDLEDYRLEAVVIATAGVDTAKDQASARQVFAELLPMENIGQLVVINDAMAAMVNAGDQRPAMVLIGGTGVSCVGQNQAGAWCKVSGLDYLLADEGSGYDAGRLALRAAVQSADGRGPKSKLEVAVLQHFEVEDIYALKDEIYSPLIGKEQIASLAIETLQLAREGDQVAHSIIDYCIKQQLLCVTTVCQELEFGESEFQLIPTGSFLLNLLPEFEAQLAVQVPQAKVVRLETTPVYGSLAIAQKILQGAQIEEFDLRQLTK